MSDFDAIVIGSGFGGAITACRLAEAGYSVLVLERGRRWDATTFRASRRRLDLGPATRSAHNGWFDMRMFPHMTVAQGAGVGGGSLVYTNISIEAKHETFATGWPPEITLQRAGAALRRGRRDAERAAGARRRSGRERTS